MTTQCDVAWTTLALVLLVATSCVAQPGTGPGTGPIPCGLQSGWPYYPYYNNQTYTGVTVQTLVTSLTARPFAGGAPVANAGVMRLTLYGSQAQIKIYFDPAKVGAPLRAAKPSLEATYVRFNFFFDGEQEWRTDGSATNCNVAKSSLQFAVRWGQTTSSTLAPGSTISFSADYQNVYITQQLRNVNLGAWYYNQGELCNDGLQQGGPFNTWELGMRAYKLANQEPTAICGSDNVNATSILFRFTCGADCKA